MTLTDTRNAIGSVTRLIADHLIRRTGSNVTIGRPENAAGGASSINVFLFEVGVDASLRNVSLRDHEPAPLWLVLKYLLTAFDDTGESESAEAHDLLGAGMSALQEMAMLSLDATAAVGVRAALESNPEPLKITFDQTPPDLLNKVMHASDDEYRISVAFEIRPVLVVPPEPTSHNLLVGVDYFAPATADQPDFVGVDVLASLGPRLRDITPSSFAVGDSITASGNDLHLADLSCWLGSVELAITLQRPNRMRIEVTASLASSPGISAGEHPFVLRQFLPETGRGRKSNILVGRLIPTVVSAVPGVMVASPDNFLIGDIVINGVLLGTADDTIQVVLYADGRAIQTIEIAKAPPVPDAPPDPQTSLTLSLLNRHRIVAGSYLIIVAVNGQQARNCPRVTLAA